MRGVYFEREFTFFPVLHYMLKRVWLLKYVFRFTHFSSAESKDCSVCELCLPLQFYLSLLITKAVCRFDSCWINSVGESRVNNTVLPGSAQKEIWESHKHSVERCIFLRCTPNLACLACCRYLNLTTKVIIFSQDIAYWHLFKWRKKISL